MGLYKVGSLVVLLLVICGVSGQRSLKRRFRDPQEDIDAFNERIRNRINDLKSEVEDLKKRVEDLEEEVETYPAVLRYESASPMGVVFARDAIIPLELQRNPDMLSGLFDNNGYKVQVTRSHKICLSFEDYNAEFPSTLGVYEELAGGARNFIENAIEAAANTSPNQIGTASFCTCCPVTKGSRIIVVAEEDSRNVVKVLLSVKADC